MINIITIKGRLGHDPEVTEKQGKSGPFAIAKFSVAVDRAFGDEVDWFNCEVLGNRANVIDKYFKKGTVITLTGSMFSYKTKDGHKGYKIKVLDFDLPEFGEHDGDRSEHGTSDQTDTFEDIDEDVPF